MTFPRQVSVIVHSQKEFDAVQAVRKIYEGKDLQRQRRQVRETVRPTRVNASRAYEKRLAGHVFKEADRTDPNRIYTNAEFEIFVQKNGDSYAGVGPMIKYMRDKGYLSGTGGHHKLHWSKWRADV